MIAEIHQQFASCVACSELLTAHRINGHAMAKTLKICAYASTQLVEPCQRSYSATQTYHTKQSMRRGAAIAESNTLTKHADQHHHSTFWDGVDKSKKKNNNKQ